VSPKSVGLSRPSALAFLLINIRLVALRIDLLRFLVFDEASIRSRRSRGISPAPSSR